LKGEVVLSMLSPVEDVEEGDGEESSFFSAQVAIKGHLVGLGGGFGARKRDPQSGICPEAGFVRGSIQFYEAFVNALLVGGVTSLEGWGDDLVNILDGTKHPFPLKALRVPISEFQGFVTARACSAGDRGSAPRPVGKVDIHFYRGVSPAIQDFSGDDGGDSHTLGSLPVEGASS
jgi:hypothetical protein